MSTLASTLHRAVRWHRPLMLTAAASLAVLVLCLIGLVADDRVLVGAPIWLKPAKFAVSIVIYSVTLAWLLSLLRRWRRLGGALGTVIAVMLAAELAIIVLQVVRGRMSHFNFTTPLDATLFVTMAGMITTLWVANLVAGVLFLVQRLGERSVTWAVRAGTAIALAGMAVAFAMPQRPAAPSVTRDAGPGAEIYGAHTVGTGDGGPGLPVTGWSTVAGDLRVPHFIGIHGLQALILVALLLTALGGRYALLSSDAVRTRVVLVLAGGYAGVLALTTMQAFRGQSVVQPDAITIAIGAGIAVATVAGLALALTRRAQPGPPTTQEAAA